MGFYPGDLIFALVLVIISFFKPELKLFICLFFLGILRGMEDFIPGIIYGFYFVFTANMWEQLKKYLKVEGVKLNCALWSLNILLFLFFNALLWAFRLDIETDWILILNKSVQFVFYFLTTLVWTFVFYFLFKKWILIESEYKKL